MLFASSTTCPVTTLFFTSSVILVLSIFLSIILLTFSIISSSLKLTLLSLIYQVPFPLVPLDTNLQLGISLSIFITYVDGSLIFSYSLLSLLFT